MKRLLLATILACAICGLGFVCGALIKAGLERNDTPTAPTNTLSDATHATH